MGEAGSVVSIQTKVYPWCDRTKSASLGIARYSAGSRYSSASSRMPRQALCASHAMCDSDGRFAERLVL